MPKVSKSKMGAFLAEIKQDGVKTVYADPKNIAGSKMDRDKARWGKNSICLTPNNIAGSV